MGKLKQITLLILVAAAMFWIGRQFPSGPDQVTPGGTAAGEAGRSATPDWTCSMHPAVRLFEGDKCPICFMDLIEVEQDDLDDDSPPRTLRLSRAAAALAEVETAIVSRRPVAVEVSMVGKVDFDETRVTSITAWVAGRLERLFVDYTGVPVSEGDHMVVLYSPELLSAQEDLLSAARVLAEQEDNRFAQRDVNSSRERLSRFGLTATQVSEIEARGEASDSLTIHAPRSGIVVQKNGLEGMYVQEGTRIYTIADLRHLWIKFDAYESDLVWLRLGQEVEFSTDAYPGDRFSGRVAFIDRVLDDRTRSVKVRVNVSNEDGRLKPGMFAKAVVRAELAEGGLVRNSFLRGKWMCPMHPDVVEEAAGGCSLCQMPLVTAEALGYVGEREDPGLPLVIPATAPLITGKRAVVYVQVDPGQAGSEAPGPTFEGRLVELGARAGDYYEVRQGLREGERVVVRGNFKIDSALQIKARPSMMSLTGDEPIDASGESTDSSASTLVAVRVSEEFRAQLAGVVEGYLLMSENLAGDDAVGARLSASWIDRALAEVDASLLSGTARDAWEQDRQNLTAGVQVALEGGERIEALRKGLRILSEALPPVLIRYRPTLRGELHRFFCPMAFNDQGGTWFQLEPQIANPYFGAVMLRCGEEVQAP